MFWIVIFGLGVLLLGGAVAALRALRVARDRRLYAVEEHPGFLDDDECAHLIAIASPELKRSQTHEGREGRDSALRESQTAFLDHRGDAVIQRIKQRLAQLTKTRRDQQEKIQVTHYDESQYYYHHFDALRASSDVDLGSAGDRRYTVILYLNDGYRGGATHFPRIGRRIRPEKGKAVFFRNLDEEGNPEPLALHGGERVRGGEKWIANQWIREGRRHPARSTRQRDSPRRRSAPR